MSERKLIVKDRPIRRFLLLGSREWLDCIRDQVDPLLYDCTKSYYTNETHATILEGKYDVVAVFVDLTFMSRHHKTFAHCVARWCQAGVKVILACDGEGLANCMRANPALDIHHSGSDLTCLNVQKNPIEIICQEVGQCFEILEIEARDPDPRWQDDSESSTPYIM